MSITEFFKGKSVFITGGSGFIGKVLIEKLLRTCSGIDTIYILLRDKKGVTPKERIKSFTDIPLFDVLKKQDADAIKKLVPICGDVTQLQLGISNDDRQTLIERVHIIYHAAASVRFDDPLKDSIILNTRGTREVTDLALQIKNLEAFIHISTTYCQTDKDVVEEKVYPAHADWKDAISIAESGDNFILDIFTPKYTKPFPNTYTFTKSLGEQVVNDMCKGNIPSAIFRPSVVIPSFREPIMGWNDNFNGPMGLLSAAGKGLLKAAYGCEDAAQDLIPVDILIKILVLSTCERIKNKDLNEVMVFNGCSGGLTVCSIRDMIKLGARLTWDVPFKEILWYPYFRIYSNWYLFYTVFILYQMIPAIFFDVLLKFSKRKPMIKKIQRKIYNANMALVYYASNTWHFKNDKFLTMLKNLPERDKENFDIEVYFSEDEIYEFYKQGKIGVSNYIFKEGYDRKLGRKVVWRMWALDLLLHAVLVSIVCWFLIAKVGILNIVNETLNNSILYLVNLK